MLVIVVTFSVLVLALVVVAARRRHFLLSQTEENRFSFERLPKQSNLFSTSKRALAEIEHHERQRELGEQRERLLAWASLGDFSALRKTAVIGDENLWQDALEILTERAATNEDVCALAEFVLANKLEANTKLVNAFRQIWENAPDRQTTVKLFQLTILDNDADLFLTVLVRAVELIKTGKLADLQIDELHEFAASHYWLLNDSARNSGARFMLRQKISQFSING